MRFATIVFRIAAIWGIPLLTILSFMFNIVPAGPVAPMTYPQAYFGFMSLAMVWQIAFLVIASDPVRFRPMMICRSGGATDRVVVNLAAAEFQQPADPNCTTS